MYHISFNIPSVHTVIHHVYFEQLGVNWFHWLSPPSHFVWNPHLNWHDSPNSFHMVFLDHSEQSYYTSHDAVNANVREPVANWVCSRCSAACVPVWTKKQCSHSTNVGTEVLGYASGIYNLLVHCYLPALFMWIKTKLRSTKGQESSREFEIMIRVSHFSLFF